MSHGSVQKAGKVRKQTPKVPAKPRPGTNPRVRFKKLYYNREIKGKYPGQPTSIGSRRR